MKNKKTNNSARFTVNFFKSTITGTKTSFNRAGKGIEPHYSELTALIKEFPDFALVIKEPKKKSDKPKKTYEGMDFQFMEDYISIQTNSAILMSEFKAVKAFAKNAKLGVYPTTKKWFLGEFDPDKLGFDIAKAKEEIKQAHIDNVILSAHDKKAEEIKQTVIDNADALDMAS